jgi:uncharacterized protein YbjT (DUF2867 family)
MGVPSSGRVLLLGATGFIGRRLLHALEGAGYDVVCGVREPARFPKGRAIAVDYARDHSEADWLPRLAAIDYVVNAVGILRETRTASFEALHVAAPVALFRASHRAGVRKVLQVSALGADEQALSAYHLSKKRADDALASLALPWVIVQPSLVFGLGGASAALFTRLAALPVVPVPGNGAQAIQPIHVDDLTAAIVRLLQTGEYDRQRIAAVGPRALTLREFLAVLRRGMRLGDARFLHVPMALVRIAAAAGDKLPGVLLDRESLGMLVRGNVAPATQITAVLGRPLRPAEQFVEPEWAHAVAAEARLAWLLPLLRVAVALVWIVTGVVSLGVYPVEESYALLARVGLTGVAASLALYGAAILDLAFGVGILVVRRRRRRLWLWRAQMALIAGYTAIISFFLPEFWAHPYGPLTKNLPMVVAILMLHEFERGD